MSPEDIDRVTRLWNLAIADRPGLTRAIGDRLDGSDGRRTARAEWIVRSVSCLAPVLPRPTAFAPAAAELIALRYPVTLDELATERDALLGALDERCGPLDREGRHSWDLAFGLFAEIVGDIGLDPFGCGEDAVPPLP